MFNEMEEHNKVFSSDIIRGQKPVKNNLYDLLNIIPTQPISLSNEKTTTCVFQPRNDKHYIPKKKITKKVKTVRDIRNTFEKDIYVYLPNELEKQQNNLLKKIRGGSSRDQNTKTLARTMFNCDEPISRSVWQMLVNINPEGHANSTQFVLWNGKNVRVNGSKGGKNKFICKYDLGMNEVSLGNKHMLNKNFFKKKKGLLHNSLSVKFKPGPLTKKKYLDDSYQKYNVGDIELVNLPKPGLDIQPTYGVSLDPTIVSFLHNLRDVNGIISEKWAEFSVSMLGSVQNTNIVQLTDKHCVTFDLNYKCDQHRILMRRANDDTSGTSERHDIRNLQQHQTRDDCFILSEVKNVIDKIIDCVEISLKQDNMYSGEEEPRDILYEDSININSNTNFKDKLKRKYGELERLDVTVIRLSETRKKHSSETCNNSYCTLGCICSSLECTYILKPHCGRVECMFECNCDYTKYKVIDSLESKYTELIPGFLNLNNEINLSLSKEEQKFHQTVIVTGEKSILLKSQKRNWKASKKYSEFFNNKCLKPSLKSNKILSLVLIKLNCKNIEPLCMVHNLYKCFCKGKFTESSSYESSKIINSDETTLNDHELTMDTSNSTDIKSNLRPRHRQEKNSATSEDIDMCKDSIYEKSTCARHIPYSGRNYNYDYYINTHKKILEMEKNDVKLLKKMLDIINRFETDKGYLQNQKSLDITSSQSNSIDELNIETHIQSPVLDELCDRSVLGNVTQFAARRLPNKTKLVAWLESSYKLYKQCVDQGINKIRLEPPKQGKVALYPWDFILGRYKERKNFFLISKQTPFRIFMAVDTKHKFFESCINIDDIRFADLQKYPVTVKNLLTNATNLKDNFCILSGLSFCWELIGSVTKVNEPTDSIKPFEETFDLQKEVVTYTSPTCSDNELSDSSSSVLENPHLHMKEIVSNSEESDVNDELSKSSSSVLENPHLHMKEIVSNTEESDLNVELSKWFVMTVENDFSEIQFNKRGFFVKYDSIVKAINVARVSGKTVRLSSQKCADRSYGPQFGIYAIPNTNECCVYIGPYEKHEALGIETVKNILYLRKQKKTRGVWITTKKVDNSKVIDNPLSFMPSINLHSNEMTLLSDTDSKINNDTGNCTGKVEKNVERTKQKPVANNIESSRVTKAIKPIRIRKNNSFYHVASNRLVKQIYLNKSKHDQGKQNSSLLINIDSMSTNPQLSNNLLAKPISETFNAHEDIVPWPDSDRLIALSEENKISKKPIAEIAPQIKCAASNSLSQVTSTESKNPDGGMFILKPEEINKKLFESKLCSALSFDKSKTTTSDDSIEDNNIDIEDFLVVSKVCTAPRNDIYVISDEEEELYVAHRDVWIQCENIDNLGWIKGQKNRENHVSFTFPGFKSSDFLTEKEAFAKINQILSRKVYIPEHITLHWQIVESENNLKTKRMLESKDLGPDFVMTKSGIQYKCDLIMRKHEYKKNTKVPDTTTTLLENQKKLQINIDDMPGDDLISELEAASVALENERQALWNETLTKQKDISRSLSEVSEGLRQQMSEKLKSILSSSDT